MLLSLTDNVEQTLLNFYINCFIVHFVSKNDTGVAHYNFDTDQPYFNNFWQVIAMKFGIS